MRILRFAALLAVLIAFLFPLGQYSWTTVDARLAQPSVSLCSKTEKILFSCLVKPNYKIVSLCASTQLTKIEGYLQYRFGTPAKVELEYPKQRADSQKAFEYNHYFRAQVDLTEISFSIDGYDYTLFDNYNGEEKPAISEEGVTVTRPNSQKDVTYSCRTKAKVDFDSLSDVLVNRSAQ